MLFTAMDPPNWNRTLAAAQKAKDLGIIMSVMTRGGDTVSEENFRKLSSGKVTWFVDENEHFERIDELIDAGTLCKVMETPIVVSTNLSGTSASTNGPEYVCPVRVYQCISCVC